MRKVERELRGLVVDRLPLAILYVNCNFRSYGVHIHNYLYQPSHLLTARIFFYRSQTHTNATITQKGDDLASTMKQRFSPPGEMGPDQEMISLSKFYYKLLMLNVAQVRYNVAVYVFDINPPHHISLSFLIINKCNPSYRTNPSPWTT